MSEYEPTQSQMSSPSNDAPKEQGGKGAFIGTIIVVLLLILLGIYVFTNRENIENGLNSNEATLIEEGIVNLPDKQRDSLQRQGASDTVDEIERDVNNTDLENLDAETQAIDEELNAL